MKQDLTTRMPTATHQRSSIFYSMLINILIILYLLLQATDTAQANSLPNQPVDIQQFETSDVFEFTTNVPTTIYTMEEALPTIHVEKIDNENQDHDQSFVILEDIKPSITVMKTNDADGNGTFSSSEVITTGVVPTTVDYMIIIQNNVTETATIDVGGIVDHLMFSGIGTPIVNSNVCGIMTTTTIAASGSFTCTYNIVISIPGMVTNVVTITVNDDDGNTAVGSDASVVDIYTLTPTNAPTDTLLPTATNMLLPTVTDTATPIPTETDTVVPTATEIPPTATDVPPTATDVPTATPTSTPYFTNSTIFGPETIQRQADLVFTVFLKNDGDESATNVTATVTLPDGVTFNEAANPQWELVDAEANSYQLTLEELGPNAEYLLPLVTRVNDDFLENGEFDPDTADCVTLSPSLTVISDNSDPFNLAPGSGANVSILGDFCEINPSRCGVPLFLETFTTNDMPTCSVPTEIPTDVPPTATPTSTPYFTNSTITGPETTQRNDDLVFTVILKNDGDEPATNVTVVVTLPDGVTFNEAANPQWELVDAETNSYQLTLEELGPNAEYSLPLVTRVNDDFLENGEFDPDTKDGVMLSPSLTVTSDNSDPFNLAPGSGANVFIIGDFCYHEENKSSARCSICFSLSSNMFSTNDTPACSGPADISTATPRPTVTFTPIATTTPMPTGTSDGNIYLPIINQ